MLTGWRARLLMVLCIALAAAGHAYAMRGMPNSPAGMLVFHGSAALLDLALLCSVPALLHGHVARDTQALMLASIIGNAVGWVLYMAYVSPVYYNVFMWGLSGTQLVRLLMVADDGLDHLGVRLVRRGNRNSYHMHTRKGSA